MESDFVAPRQSAFVATAAMLLGLSLSFGVGAPALLGVVAGQVFTDVRIGDSNYDAITYVQRQGIVAGYPDGTFRPAQPINRAEFVKMLLQGHPLADEANACAIDPDMSPLFTDLERPLAYWYGPLVCVARRAGIVNGYPDGTFRSGSLVNAAEAAKIIVQSRGLPMQAAPGMTWYEPYIQALRQRNAWPQRLQRPEQLLLRSDMAEILYRLAGSPHVASTPSSVAVSSVASSSSSSRAMVTISVSSDDSLVLTGSRRTITTSSATTSPSSFAVRSSSPPPPSRITSSSVRSSLSSAPVSSSSVSQFSARSDDLQVPSVPYPARWAQEREGVMPACLQSGQGILLDRANFGMSNDGAFILAARFMNAAGGALREQLFRWDRFQGTPSLLAEDGVLFGARRARMTPQGDAVAYAVQGNTAVTIFLRTFRSATPIVLAKESELFDPVGVQPLIAADGRYVLFTVRENGVLVLRVYDRQSARLQTVAAAKDDGDGNALFLPPLPQLLYVVMADGALRTFDLERELRARNVQPKGGVEQAIDAPAYSSADGAWIAMNLWRRDTSDAPYRVLVFGRENGQTTLLGPVDVLRQSDYAVEPDDARWQLSVHGMTADGTALLLRLRTQGHIETRIGADGVVRCQARVTASAAQADPHAACVEADRLLLYDWRARRTVAIVTEVRAQGDRPIALYLPAGYPAHDTIGVAGGALSADGRYVLFMLDDDVRANTLMIGGEEQEADTLHHPAVFLYDRQSHVVERVLESSCLNAPQ